MSDDYQESCPSIEEELDYYKRTLAERDKELEEVKDRYERERDGNDVLKKTLRAQLLAAQTVNGKMREALVALRDHYKEYSISGVVYKQVEEALESSPDPTLLDEVVKVLEMAYNRALDWDMLGRAHGNSAVQMWRENAIRLLSRLRQSTRETEDKV